MDETHREGIARIRELRAAYMEAHKAGMAALERHDLKALSEAIDREKAILYEQQALVAALLAPPLDPLAPPR